MHGLSTGVDRSRMRRRRAGRYRGGIGVGAVDELRGYPLTSVHNHRPWRNCKSRSGGRYRIRIVVGG